MAFLDPVLDPILTLGPFWAIFALSLGISIIIVLVYKFFTNQQEMKRLKEEQKEYQKKLKELRKSNPEKMMEIQKEAMQKNIQYMKHSFKATFITILPIILIFSWMNAHLAYEPIFPGERYSITATFEAGVTGTAELLANEGTELLSDAVQPVGDSITWNLRSSEGRHLLTVKTEHDEQSKAVLVTQTLGYEEPFKTFSHSDIKQITIDYKKLRPAGDFSLFSWQPGWLGWYIFLSIIFSIGLRKAFKVY